MTGRPNVEGNLPGEWVNEGACFGEPVSVMFPTGGPKPGVHGNSKLDWDTPRSLCAVCPVRNDCLNHALTHNEEWGMWGGMTPDERQREKRRRRRALAQARSLERTVQRVREIVK